MLLVSVHGTRLVDREARTPNLGVGMLESRYEGRASYLVAGINGRERAFESRNFLTASVGLERRISAAQQVIVTVFDGCYSVVRSSKHGGIGTEKSLLALEESIVAIVACEVDIAITARLGLT